MTLLLIRMLSCVPDAKVTAGAVVELINRFVATIPTDPLPARMPPLAVFARFNTTEQLRITMRLHPSAAFRFNRAMPHSAWVVAVVFRLVSRKARPSMVI